MTSWVKVQCVSSAARGLSVKTMNTKDVDDVVKQEGIMGIAVFIVKQPLLPMKFYLT